MEKSRQSNQVELVKPMLTVITVTYNCVQDIEKTILSIHSQTFKNYQHIIYDGKSSDGTVQIIEKHITDNTIFISKPDEGIYDAMNKALDLACGEFVIFMNAGDSFYTNTTLDGVFNKITNKNNVYYGDANFSFRNNDKFVKGGKFNKYKLSYINMCHQTIFYPEIVYLNNRYNLHYKLLADYAMNISIFTKTKFVYLDQIISNYDAEGLSATQIDVKFKKDHVNMIRTYLGYSAFLYRKYIGLMKYFNLK